MSKKEQDHKHHEGDDIAIDYDDETVAGFQMKDKNKKLRDELQDSKKQAQEYLVGWQKERADFANYKAQEEKKRQERIASLRTNLVSDFFPVLDSFDMAFANKETWEKVDQGWRTGIEYIHSQFMRVLEDYHVSLIDRENVPFDPFLHDPVDTIEVDDASGDGVVKKIIQKGYQVGENVLRPAKVQVGKYTDPQDTSALPEN